MLISTLALGTGGDPDLDALDRGGVRRMTRLEIAISAFRDAERLLAQAFPDPEAHPPPAAEAFLRARQVIEALEEQYRCGTEGSWAEWTRSRMSHPVIGTCLVDGCRAAVRASPGGSLCDAGHGGAEYDPSPPRAPQGGRKGLSW
jgi:hypothetical protein